MTMIDNPPETETGGNGLNTGQLPIPSIYRRDLHGPAVLIGGALDTGNPGARILNSEHNWESKLRSSRVPLKIALHAANAKALVDRHNEKGENDDLIDNIALKLAAISGQDGVLIRAYLEGSVGVVTTDSLWRPFKFPWSKEKELKRDGADGGSGASNPLLRKG